MMHLCNIKQLLLFVLDYVVCFEGT